MTASMMETNLNSSDTAVVSAGTMTELVRGTEQALLAWLTPMVRRQSVTLDLAPVTRIDAAGIATLLSLHATAEKCGNQFHVTGLSPRVSEILSLVGLSEIFPSRNVVRASHDGVRLCQPAA